MKTAEIRALIAALILSAASEAAAGDDAVNENRMFSEGDSVTAVEDRQDDTIADVANRESVSLSGDIAGKLAYELGRDYFEGDADLGDNPYSTSMSGDLLLDVRLQKGVKAFGDFYVSYSPQNDPQSADHFRISLKELFAAANIASRVYFQFGKQTLKWGQGYFWNPTDLISVDRRDFKDMNARREGVYGLKMHVPFGTAVNVYGFFNAGSADRIDEIAVAGKIEFLLPRTVEAAVSAWTKNNYETVYGLDFRASPDNKTQAWGELALSHGDNRRRLTRENGAYVDTRVTDEWVARACVGLSRSFDIGDVNDRLSVLGEFYYNGGGYGRNMLEDETRAQFLDGGFFESGNYGEYYAAAFISLQRFLLRDMALKLNVNANLSDRSAALLSGVDYLITDNATFSFDLVWYLGPEDREFTLGGNVAGLQAVLRLAF